MAVWAPPANAKEPKLELFDPPKRTFTTIGEIACNFKTGKVAQRGKLIIEILYDLETESVKMQRFDPETREERKNSLEF